MLSGLSTRCPIELALVVQSKEATCFTAGGATNRRLGASNETDGEEHGDERTCQLRRT